MERTCLVIQISSLGQSEKRFAFTVVFGINIRNVVAGDQDFLSQDLIFGFPNLKVTDYEIKLTKNDLVSWAGNC
jgi:hypothetical protein